MKIGWVRLVIALAALLLITFVLLRLLGPTRAAFPEGTLPPGIYLTELTSKDIAASSPEEVILFVGRWSIVFVENGRFILSRNELIVVNGAYKITGNRIILTKETGHYACTGENWETVQEGENPGTYEWVFDERILTLTKVSDACAPRVRILTTHPWTKR